MADGRRQGQAERGGGCATSLLVRLLLQAGIVHCDISPRNLYVFGNCTSSDGCRLKIGGLSACSPTDRGCPAHGKEGEAHYLPPEARREGSSSVVATQDLGEPAGRMGRAGGSAGSHRRLSEACRPDPRVATRRCRLTVDWAAAAPLGAQPKTLSPFRSPIASLGKMPGPAP